MLRQPVIVILGHVDHGKTSILDKIRQTAIAAKEAGGITQAIGTTEISSEVIKGMCDTLIKKFNFTISVPGILFIDTPGHEAFTTLRRRGGSIADLAVLVVDINEGLMPQTVESIEILKESKTPFVVAMNKIDRISGWQSGECFLDNFPKQSGDVQGTFEQKFYEIINQLSNKGINADRFDRVNDFRNTVAAVPVSARSGEGIPDLLVTILGLAQTFLKEQLVSKEKSEGMVLEVKEVTGLGITLDSIIYDGSIAKNDFLVVGGRAPIIAKVRALMTPEPMRDMRTEKKFRSVEQVFAAAGVKIVAPGLENVIAGSPIRTAKSFEEAEKLLDELEKEKEEVEISSEEEGLILKADTLGSLEALINVFKNYPVREATIGNVTKKDVIKAEVNKNNLHKALIAFNSTIAEDAEMLAKDKNVKVLQSDIIYRLIEDYEKWTKEEEEKQKKKEIEGLTRPAEIKLIPGSVFRASDPAIVGCEVYGLLKPGSDLMKEDGQRAGSVKQIQSQGQNVDEAKTGDKVAVSIVGPTIGRQIKENETLFTDMNGNEFKMLRKNERYLTQPEISALEKIFAIKRKNDPRFGL
ncbi:MAG: translation initiation factor IF-2 [Candidatus Aenigmarchaeota archaeon]|nr:translation initiation factor IF-2 [Candidatus Aenigmarchaeota archaeon]